MRGYTMSNNDASELRCLAKMANARRANEERLAKQRETARVELEAQVSGYLHLCMSAASKNQTTIQVPCLHKEIARRLAEYGLTASSEPSKEAIEIAVLEQALCGQTTELEASFKHFHADFLEYLQASGKLCEHDLRLSKEVESLSLENFEQVFPMLPKLVPNLTDQQLLSIRQAIKSSGKKLNQARSAHADCESEIVLNRRKIENANRAPSSASLTLIEQRMRTNRPTVEVHFNDEFQNYFSDTIDMALEGDGESFRSRWLAMEKALVDQKIGPTLAQITIFQNCVKQRISGFRTRTKLAPNEIHALRVKNASLDSTVQHKLNRSVQACESELMVLRGQEQSLNQLVYELKSRTERWNKVAAALWQAMNKNKRRIACLQLSPSTVSRISWPVANRSEPGSAPPSDFAAMLRFISGPKWNTMYATIKAKAKRAATTGDVSCAIAFSIGSDASFHLNVGKTIQVIPCISPAEFCTLLQERSGMKCKILKSKETWNGTIQLSW
jgi:hypothetical protein